MSSRLSADRRAWLGSWVTLTIGLLTLRNGDMVDYRSFADIDAGACPVINDCGHSRYVIAAPWGGSLCTDTGYMLDHTLAWNFSF